MTVLRVWMYLIASAVVSYVGFALLDGSWDNHPHTPVGWVIYLGGFVVIGSLCSWGLLLTRRRRERARVQ
jgi:hypothetical protein